MTKQDQNQSPTDPVREAAARAERFRAFGAKLCALREASQLSRISLAQATRINPNFIIAMEAGDFGHLPGEVFTRGFLKSMAKALNTDAQELLAEYGALSGPAAAADDSVVLEVVTTSRPRPPFGANVRAAYQTFASLMRRGLGVRLAGLAVVLAIAGFGLVRLYNANRDALMAAFSSWQGSLRQPVATVATTPEPASSGAAGQAATVAPDAAPAVQPVALTESAPPDSAAIQTAPEAASGTPGTPGVVNAETPAPSPAAEPVAVTLEAPAASAQAGSGSAPAAGESQTLEVVVLEPVKLRVELDGGAATVTELKPDTYRYTFLDRAELLIYDAAAVKINFNGRSLGTLGNKGRIRRVSFKASGQDAKSL